MKQLRLVGAASVALLALGIATAATAFALPDISVTLTSTYPLHLEVTLLTLKVKLSSTATKGLNGEGLLLLLLTEALTSLGTFEVLFLNLENVEKTTCSSTGDKAAEVLASGTFHIVYTSLAGSAPGLQLGLLLLLLPFTVTCGEEKVKNQGSTLAAISGDGAGTEAPELTSLTGTLTGNGIGVPTYKVYYNDAGEPKEARLESNFGSGFIQTAEETGPVTAAALEGKMFVITGR